MVKVYANGNDEQEIWKSEIEDSIGDFDFSIAGLDGAKEFKNIKIEIVDGTTPDEILVEKTDVVDGTITTLDIVNGFDVSTEIDTTSIDSSSFKIKAKVTSANNKENVDAYKFKVTGSDGIDFTTEEFNTTTPPTIEITG